MGLGTSPRVTGNSIGALVVETQSIKATKSLANDTGTVRLGGFQHWLYAKLTLTTN